MRLSNASRHLKGSKRKLIISLLILHCFLVDVYALTDSSSYYFNNLNNGIGDSIDNYLGLSDYYCTTDLDSARYFANKALNLSQRDSAKLGIYQSYILLASISRLFDHHDSARYYFTNAYNFIQNISDNDTLLGNYHLMNARMLVDTWQASEAIDEFTNAMKVYEKSGHDNGIAAVYYNLGRLYDVVQDQRTSIKYYEQALEIFDKEKFPNLYYHTLNQLGACYLYLNQMEEARSYITESVEGLKNSPHLNLRANSLRFLGIFYLHNEKTDSARMIFNEGIDVCRMNRNYTQLGDLLTLISHSYHVDKDYKKSLEYNLMALEIRKGIKLNTYIGSSLINVANSYNRLNQTDSAIIYARQGLDIARRAEKYFFISAAYKSLSAIFENKGKSDSALKYFKMYKTASDSLNLEILDRELSRYRSKVELQKKENDLNLLRLSRQKMITYLLFAIVALVIVLIVFVFLRYRQKKHDNELLTEQKDKLNETLEKLNQSRDELEQANRRLTDFNKKLESMVEERTVELRSEIEYRKFAEKNLIESKNKIEESFKKEKELNLMKTTLISTVSHEFKNPMTVILSSAEMMELFLDREEPDKTRENLGKIRKAIVHMNELITDVLIYGKSGHRDRNINPEEFDLLVITRELIENVRLFDKERHEFRLIPAMDEIIIFSDKNSLKHILRNLLSNAAKFSPNARFVDIFVRKDKSFVTIEVQDYGIGIPKADMAEIFSPFHRGRNTGKISGTGFGLAIVKNYIDILQGTIEVESEIDGGTKFKVRIPVYLRLNGNPESEKSLRKFDYQGN